jgi:hypothetical protein
LRGAESHLRGKFNDPNSISSVDIDLGGFMRIFIVAYIRGPSLKMTGYEGERRE